MLTLVQNQLPQPPPALLKDTEAFHAHLRTAGACDSPALRPDDISKGFARWRFHLGMLRIVRDAAQLAQHGAFDRRAWAVQGFSAQRLVERLGGSVHFKGFAEAAALQGPAVWVANHMSALETFVLPSALLAFGDIRVVLKRSLTHYPLFGKAIRAIEPIAVSRSKPREDLVQVLREGRESLRRGRSILLFPQATRSRELDRRKFNSLGVKLAQRAGVPVIPVALATDFSATGRWIKEFGPVDTSLPVRFEAAAPIGPGINAREWHAAVFNAIAERLEAWQYPVRRQE